MKSNIVTTREKRAVFVKHLQLLQALGFIQDIVMPSNHIAYTELVTKQVKKSTTFLSSLLSLKTKANKDNVCYLDMSMEDLYTYMYHEYYTELPFKSVDANSFCIFYDLIHKRLK